MTTSCVLSDEHVYDAHPDALTLKKKKKKNPWAFRNLRMRNAHKILQSGGRPPRSRSKPHGYFLCPVHRCQRRCVASAPGPLGTVPRASNSQQAMWENSHQQVRVKSAAGSRPRCLRLCPLSASLSGSLLIDSQSMSTFFRRRCDLLHCHRDPPLF